MNCPKCEQEANEADRYDLLDDDGASVIGTAWYCFDCDYEWDIFEDAEEESRE